MTTNPTTEILARAEWPEPVVRAADLAGWPVAARERFVRLGVLVKGNPAESFACDACGFDHVEPVEWHREPGHAPRVCIRCPDVGLVWLAPADLDRWAVHRPALANGVAAAVGAAGGVSERVPGRVWKLGTVRAGGRVWAAVLAVGLGHPDGAAVVARAAELRAPNALVFVPAVLPAESVWSADRAPAVVPLADLLSLGPRGLVADRDALASALPAAQRTSAKGPVRTFPTPPGTAWERVALTVEEDHVRVHVGTRVERLGFAAAGFEDRRKRGKPDELWALLTLFARSRGVLRSNDPISTKGGSLKQKMSTLRDRLRTLLALEGDPFHRTRPGQPYRARFTIQNDGAATFLTLRGATWDDISITETAAGTITVAVTVETRTATVARSDGTTGRWEGATDTSDRHSRYALADLGLAGSDDNPTPAGAALIAVLRANGRIAGAENDTALLALSAALARVFPLSDPPFTFDDRRRRWVARFEAASVVPASEW